MGIGQRRTAGGKDWPLVGRDAELASLDAVADHVLSGRSHVVQIEGAAGIGKSALLSTWCRGDDRFRVLRAWCHPLEQEFAFGAVRQLFKPAVTSATDADRATLLDGAAGALRILADGVPTDPAPGGPTGATALAGLDQLARSLSDRRPLLLVIDDLQWIDPPSLRWLAHFVRPSVAVPTLVAVITRTTEFRNPDPLFTELVHPASCHTIVLEPLGVPAVRQLAEAVWEDRVPDPSFCTAAHAATGGHPLFLCALLHHAQLSGVKPTAEFRDQLRTVTLSTLRREILHRLSQGSQEVVDLARALALLGDRKPPQLLAAHCGRGEAVVRSAAADLRSLGLLRAGDDPCFVHQVVRDTVLATMSCEELGQGHARAAHISYLGGRPDEEVAAHLLAADPVRGGWAVPVLRGAAAQALRRGAPEAAVTYLRFALNQCPQAAERGSVLLQLGVAASHYDADLALSYVTSALEVLTDETARHDALGLLTYCLLISQGSRSVLSDLDGVIAELCARAETDGEGELVLRMRALRLWMEYERPSARAAAPSPSVSVAGLSGSTPGERQLLAVQAFQALRAARPAPYVAALVDRACVNLPVMSHDLFPLHYFVAQTLLYLDELDRADGVRAQLAQGTAGRGMELLDSSLTLYRSALALHRGDVTEALATAQAVVDHGCASGQLPYATALDVIRIDALLEQGRLAAAERVALARSRTGLGESAWERPLFLKSLAGVRIAQGDPRVGLALLYECGHHLEALGTVSPVVCPWRSRAAAAHLVLGESSAAHALLEQELDLARRCQIPRAVGVALRAAGQAAGATKGLDLLNEAVSVLSVTPARLELARALHDLGVASLRRGDTRAAREALRHGLSLAVDCGATRLAKAMRERLHDAGGRVGRSGKGPGVLTPGQERVSALAAQGYSNKEIAELLVVSLRTVETHLTSAYRKLGIAGRSQLAAAIADPAGLPGTRTAADG